MKCPFCSREAQEGGLIAESVVIGWIPLKEIKKGPLKELIRLSFPGLRTISNRSYRVKCAKVPNAYYCEHCNKVFGIFDVTDNE